MKIVYDDDREDLIIEPIKEVKKNVKAKGTKKATKKGSTKKAKN
tara:strand:+ start:400 stop:531 length:132 start_codon:yes stop_codon:yes gene_type:complete